MVVGYGFLDVWIPSVDFVSTDLDFRRTLATFQLVHIYFEAGSEQQHLGSLYRPIALYSQM